MIDRATQFQSTMATKIKGICKGFKYITQFFVVKDRDMDIGYPTDVKHVAHIGWDGPSGSGPSWMNEFKTAPDFSTSIGSLSERRDPNPTTITSSRSVQDFEATTGSQPKPNLYQGISSAGVTHVHKKAKRKKIKSTSSPKASSAATRQSRAARTKAMYCEREAAPIG